MTSQDVPQSLASDRRGHSQYAAPGPPSSHMPSFTYGQRLSRSPHTARRAAAETADIAISRFTHGTRMCVG